MFLKSCAGVNYDLKGATKKSPGAQRSGVLILLGFHLKVLPMYPE
jgi:hypothetical protein